MYRVKKLFGGNFSLQDYDVQVAEAMNMIYALNNMTLARIPESVRGA
ncbi:MAG: IS5/IS1182 family transposase, partial [Serratia symbiotica]|nr:IS5/IS1182 family transposase [Serratia symbiotica]